MTIFVASYLSSFSNGSFLASFKKAIPGLFFIYFRLFKETLQFLQQINEKQYPSSTRCWDLNPQPLDCESHPITTRPGLPPNPLILYFRLFNLLVRSQDIFRWVNYFICYNYLSTTCWKVAQWTVEPTKVMCNEGFIKKFFNPLPLKWLILGWPMLVDPHSNSQ